jgi:tetratricopeptide (TPR) repeat protein
MSSDLLEAEADMCCASCGTAEVDDDDIKLKDCDDSDLVKYCSDKCQRDHLTEHEKACKERAAELRDEILFRQPESSHWGDCPICILPLSIDMTKSTLYSCCSKFVCSGCNYANQIREFEGRLEQSCPFCRHPLPKTQKEMDKNKMKRVAANDPFAIRQMGKKHYIDGDYESAFKFYTKAAELGDVEARYNLSLMYRNGKGVEKDEKKEVYHLEEAAIAGHPLARHDLGIAEGKNGRFERAVKHWIIAAKLGYDDSIKALKECYAAGVVSKEEFAAALRAHQAAVDATKSPQREAAMKRK